MRSSTKQKNLSSKIESLFEADQPIEVSSLVHQFLCPLPIHFSTTLFGDLIDASAPFKARVQDVLILAFLASQGFTKNECLFEVLLLDDQDTEKELLLRVVVAAPKNGTQSATIGYPEDF
jgi:hypothetical protein